MKTIKILTATFLMLFAVSNLNAQRTIYDFQVKDIDGKTVDMSDFKGKTVLIVNTASKCGLTPQYEFLEYLYKEYQEKGLIVLAFPCNQFAGQEPGDSEEIKSFCTSTYDVTFPIMAKIDVNGKDAAPIYKFLKKQAPFVGYPEKSKEFGQKIDAIHSSQGTGYNKGDNIRWNFTKFLISKDGEKIIRLEPMVTGKDLEQAVIQLL